MILPENSNGNNGKRHTIFELRRLERSGALEDTRTLSDYVKCLQGIRGTLLHVSQHGATRRGLDIGIGQGIGLLGLAELARTYGVTFEGTGLTKPAAFETVSGDARPRFHRTTAERLRDVPNNSYDVVTSVFGAAYAEQTSSAKRINEILAPGGIFKGTFTVKRLSGQHKRGMHAVAEFEKTLLELGYDVFSAEIPEDRDPNINTEHALLVAVKPGSASSLSAKEVFEMDKNMSSEEI